MSEPDDSGDPGREEEDARAALLAHGLAEHARRTRPTSPTIAQLNARRATTRRLTRST